MVLLSKAYVQALKKEVTACSNSSTNFEEYDIAQKNFSIRVPLCQTILPAVRSCGTKSVALDDRRTRPSCSPHKAYTENKPPAVQASPSIAQQTMAISFRQTGIE